MHIIPRLHTALILATMLTLNLISCSSSGGELNQSDWQQYKARFISPAGKVLDTGQAGAVHSEGQSYGMMLAVSYSDQQYFQLIWDWTQKNLQKRGHDKLFAWNWDGKTKKIADYNNATDADLMIAWALYRASKKWGNPAYKASADAILSSIKSLLVQTHGRSFLMPAEHGFRIAGKIILNPSYLLLPAYLEFADGNNDIDWRNLYADGIWLLQTARFGKWQLSGDWVTMSETIELTARHKPTFGYDAIRVPLYAAWANEKEIANRYVNFWQNFKMMQSPPDITDLKNDFTHLNPKFKAPYAINELCKKNLNQGDFPAMSWEPDTLYYDASLRLLTQIAWVETPLHKQ